MRSLLAVVSLAVAGLGCATFSSATLVVDSALHDTVAAPVVCGPMGFRKSPLQSRWGEYVRVTVQAPGALSGTAFINANGAVGETRAWNTEQGDLVVEARFENLDPDALYALRREQPIDVTLSGLSGACEGAVFTVEQGELVPSIDERAWVEELVRRGGPELAQRREARRVEMEARRQAHYAAWEARREAGPALVADVAVREAHYAAWDLRRAGAVQAEGDVELELAASNVACAAVTTQPAPAAWSANTSGRCVSCGAVVAGPVGASLAVGAASTPSASGSFGASVAVGGCATCAMPSVSGSVGSSVAAGAVAPVPSANGSVGASVASGGCASCAVAPEASVSVVDGPTYGAGGGVAQVATFRATGCATCSDIVLNEYPVSRTTVVASSSTDFVVNDFPTPAEPAVFVEAFPAPAPVVDDEAAFIVPAIFGALIQGAVTAPTFVPAPPPPPSRVVRAVPLGSR